MNLKQRVAVVNTIKKTSHALQLTSFAWLSRLKTTIAHIQKLKTILANLKQELGHKKALSEVTTSETQNLLQDKPILFIVLGAQRGFCGNFNALLKQAIKKTAAQVSSTPPSLMAWIGAGPYAMQFIQEARLPLALSEDNVVWSKRHDYQSWIALADYIINTMPKWSEDYQAVCILSLKAKNVLTYESHTITLPLNKTLSLHNESVWTTYQTFENKVLIMSALIDSWYTEQAARGTAMQQAHTNAETMLEALSLEYNKLRQAHITKELLELTSGHQ